jgi:hypothetical protein
MNTDLFENAALRLADLYVDLLERPECRDLIFQGSDMQTLSAAARMKFSRAVERVVTLRLTEAGKEPTAISESPLGNLYECAISTLRG